MALTIILKSEILLHKKIHSVVSLFAMYFLVSHQALIAGEKTKNRWLFIGDSHSAGFLGDGLRENLFELGLTSEKEFYQYSVSGSNAGNWLHGTLSKLSIDSTLKLPGKKKKSRRGHPGWQFKRLKTLSKKIKPETLVIALGINDFTAHFDQTKKSTATPTRSASLLPEELEKSVDKSLSSIRKLLRENTKSRCIFILPARVKSTRINQDAYKIFLRLLAGEAEKRQCLVVNSLEIADPDPTREVSQWEDCLITNEWPDPITPDRTDGFHFNQTKGLYWGHCAALYIEKKGYNKEPSVPSLQPSSSPTSMLPSERASPQPLSPGPSAKPSGQP